MPRLNAFRKDRRSPRKLHQRPLRTETLEKRMVLTAVISEILASNSEGLRDIDGDSSDWIEIYNPTTSPIDLDGWSLTDDHTDTDKWVFPDVTLDPDGFLVVFASGKDRSVAGEELHTNFQFSSSGEYVGLYQAGGAVASEYNPAYPQQTTNISYGITFRDDLVVASGDQARYHVPTNGSLGTTWQQPAFDDSSWSTGATGLGYGVSQPGFDVTYYKAQASGAFNGTVNSLDLAFDVINTPAYQAQVVESTAPVINHLGSGAGGRYGNNLAFPTQTIGVNIDNFVFEARTTIQIDSPGDYSFGVNSDDGFRLTITNGIETFSSEFPNPRGTADTIATFPFFDPGSYDVTLVMYEAGGGASVELFSAPGTHSSFNASVFDLVGDVASGGLPAAVAYTPGSSDYVATDISTEHQGVNASAYVRLPFTVTDIGDIDAVSLSILYDDGFIASINGTEVASRNAPANPAFNSTALASRDPADVIVAEEISLPATALSALVEGDNVLTIQALNASVFDPSFLILPELSVTGLLTDSNYFTTPTPGAPNQDPVEGIVERVTADVEAGFFDTSFDVTLTTPTPDATIRYTFDGSEPSETNGFTYAGPISITGTTNLRAVATKANHATLPSKTWSYFFLNDVLTQSNDGSAPAGWPTTWRNNVVDYGIDPDVIAIEGAQAVRDALLAIPTWSITTDLDNLFDANIGIYSNANQDGRDWERPASVELVHPDGSEGFQINAGLRIRGGFSRSNNNPKHSFRIFFRGSYGDSTLDYPVHGDEGTDKFKKIDLRTAQNYSWSFQGDASNAFVGDVLARYNQRDLGQPYTKSSWLHLYLNGHYWGLFQTQERAEANFGETYFGGSADDYDVLKPERGPYQNIATDGNFDAYDALFQQALARDGDGVTPAFVDFAKYMEAQGLNVDGTDNPALDNLLDVDNLIAYMITILDGGNFDAPISNFLGNNRINNYFAVRDRTGDEGFRFFIHDSEHTLRSTTRDRTGPWEHPNFESSVNYFNPQWLHQQLAANDEYRIRFADKVQDAFFHDGLLSIDAQIAKLDAEAAKLDQAIIGESARWGDAKQTNPRLRSHWVSAINNLRNNYFPNRRAVFINQLRNYEMLLKDAEGNYTVNVPAPLFPTIDAPEYLVGGQPQHGGTIAEGTEVRIAANEGLVYYTTDGSDPRLLGGGISPTAIAYDPMTVNTTLVAAGSNWKYHDQGVDLGTTWRDPSFNDTAWASGDAQLGYGDGDETTVVSFGPNASAKYRTTYFRSQFNADAGDYSNLKLRVKRDDGIVVYLNGTEIARDNMPVGTISFSTPAFGVASDDGANWHEFDIDPALLADGLNTLAVEIHQVSNTSSDISFDAELTVSENNATPIILNDSVTMRARARDAQGQWSAVHVADFVVPRVPASVDNIRITEFMYNPAGDGNAEFIEIQNITSGASGVTVDLGSLSLTGGPSEPLNLPITATLDPQEYGLIVRDTATFLATYPGVDPSLIIGDYTGALSNSGEEIKLLDAMGNTLFEFTYGDGDPWSVWADGNGGSLTLVDPLNTPADQLGKPYHWRGSTLPGGTPGASAILPNGVVINEILAHTDAPQFDTIELHNTSATDINIGGWYLSDSQSDFLKYRIPDGTILTAGGFITFDENDFNPTPLTPGPKDFALSGSHGDSVWLVIGDGPGTGVLSFVDHVDFDATFNGMTLGRTPDATSRMVPLAEASLGAANGPFATSDVVISEFNYHPADPTPAALAIDPTISASDLEFIEVHNASASTIDLTNWRLRGEGDFNFAAGQLIAAGATLVVVPFDPNFVGNVNRLAAFRAHYGIDAAVPLVGPMSGTLDNSYGIVKLQRPDTAPVDEPTVTPRVMVDESFYDDLAPWPVSADGTGDSLHRKQAATQGNEANSWIALPPTPGSILVAPSVSEIIVNGGAATRSVLTEITVVFDTTVNVSASSFALTNTTTGEDVTSLDVQSAVVDGMTETTITFLSGPSVQDRAEGGNSLDDGDYLLTILAAEVASTADGLNMHDDVNFGENALDNFFRKYGDQNGNGVVDLFDFAQFRSTFGRVSSHPDYVNELDSDGNGVVNLFDFATFRSGFGS